MKTSWSTPGHPAAGLHGAEEAGEEFAGVVFLGTIADDDGSYWIEDLPAGPCKVAMEILDPNLHWEKKSSVMDFIPGRVKSVIADEADCGIPVLPW